MHSKSGRLPPKAIELTCLVAEWANAFMISRAHTKEMVANASGRAESFTPGSVVIINDKDEATAMFQSIANAYEVRCEIAL